MTTPMPDPDVITVIADGEQPSVITLSVPGQQGPQGPPNVLSIGTVTTGAPGSSASVTITGTAPSQVLNLTIPRGANGVPVGGTTGQVLTKNSGTDLDASWTTLGTPNTVGDTVVRRDANGNTRALGFYADAAPGFPDALTRKDYVDNKTWLSSAISDATSLNTAGTIVKRGSNGDVDLGTVTVASSALAASATRKDYVDAAIQGVSAGAPAAHTHTATDISNSTATGRSVLTAVDAAAARTAIGAGTSSLALGTTAITAAAGNHTHLAANITDTTTVGRSVMTAADAAAARTAIGAGTSSLAIGTTSTTAKAGDYTPPDATTGAKGLVQLTNHLGGTATAPTVRAASDIQTGIVELATPAEATASIDNARAVTPLGLADRVIGTGVTKVVKITQAAYTALATKDSATLYVISG